VPVGTKRATAAAAAALGNNPHPAKKRRASGDAEDHLGDHHADSVAESETEGAAGSVSDVGHDTSAASAAADHLMPTSAPELDASFDSTTAQAGGGRKAAAGMKRKR
jgi:hypothetical protein